MIEDRHELRPKAGLQLNFYNKIDPEHPPTDSQDCSKI